MRPALLARVLLLAAMTAALTRAEVLPRAQARGPKPAPDTVAFSTTVKSAGASKESAIEATLSAAGTKIAEEVQKEYHLTVGSVSNNQVRLQYLADSDLADIAERERDDWKREQWNGHWILVKEDLGNGAVEKTYEVQLKVNVSAKDLDQYKNKWRERVVHERQEWLLKLLVSVVVLLGAVSGYYRLEEATKGYYTAWLRLGLIGVACVVGALLLLVVG